MNKYSIITLGCKVNQCESEKLGQQLSKKGGVPAGPNEQADLCIVNTCAVTAKAAMQSRQTVRRLIRENPNARVIVTGCYAQMAPEVIRRIDHVDQVVGCQAKDSIADMLPLAPGSQFQPDVGHIPVLPQSVGLATTRSRPFLKVQDGCNAFCTYCIVPHVRGRSRSMPVAKVLSNLRDLKEAGYHETVLTGIHLGVYGQDLSPPVTLSALLDRIEVSETPTRVRLSSIEPRELTDTIIHQVAINKRFCRHFHIPLQSGDDGILKQMGRPYTAMFFKNLVHRIVDQIPDVAIGVDILIGFPGETRQAFTNTLELIESLPVTYLHVFPFSARSGTPAATYSRQVPVDIIKERCHRMRVLGMEKKASFYRRHIGRSAKVLIENKRDPTTGWLQGVTSNYIQVLIDGDDAMKNRLVRVQINSVDEDNRARGAVV